MASTSPVLLILGAGANIGQHVARAFTAKGYKIAFTSRKPFKLPDVEDKNQVHIVADLSDPGSVPGVFEKVKASLGSPSVVIYNAAAASPNPPDTPLSVPLADFAKDLNINTNSVFAAASQAVQAFSSLPETASKTFIYTGNILNTPNVTIPPLLTLGVGKSATAHVIQAAAKGYKGQGFKFYYADERKADGAAAYGDISGEAAAEHYLHLAEGASQGPWLQTFVKGAGYKHFPAST